MKIQIKCIKLHNLFNAGLIYYRQDKSGIAIDFDNGKGQIILTDIPRYQIEVLIKDLQNKLTSK